MFLEIFPTFQRHFVLGTPVRRLLRLGFSDDMFSVTEQPYKIPYYAALLRLLHNPSELSIPDEQPLGRLVLEDFWKGFQSYLDKLSWRDTRLCVSYS